MAHASKRASWATETPPRQLLNKTFANPYLPHMYPKEPDSPPSPETTSWPQLTQGPRHTIGTDLDTPCPRERRSRWPCARTREFSVSGGDREVGGEGTWCQNPKTSTSFRQARPAICQQELDLDRRRAIETQEEQLAIPQARQDLIADMGLGRLQEFVEAGPQSDAPRHRRPHRQDGRSGGVTRGSTTSCRTPERLHVARKMRCSSSECTVLASSFSSQPLCCTL